MLKMFEKSNYTVQSNRVRQKLVTAAVFVYRVTMTFKLARWIWQATHLLAKGTFMPNNFEIQPCRTKLCFVHDHNHFSIG